MDWSKFSLAITDPGYLHGAPVFRDEPRMPVQAVLDNLDDGMTPEQIAHAWQIDLRLVAGVQHFAEGAPKR
jgi:uncharacterized protein (DUF433 family)